MQESAGGVIEAKAELHELLDDCGLRRRISAALALALLDRGWGKCWQRREPIKPSIFDVFGGLSARDELSD